MKKLIRFGSLAKSEIHLVATNPDDVQRYNDEYLTLFDSYVFTIDGKVYGCMYNEPIETDILEEV